MVPVYQLRKGMAWPMPVTNVQCGAGPRGAMHGRPLKDTLVTLTVCVGSLHVKRFGLIISSADIVVICVVCSIYICVCVHACVHVKI